MPMTSESINYSNQLKAQTTETPARIPTTIDRVHNINLKQQEFSSIANLTKPTAKKYDTITNPIDKLQKNPYLQKG
jgi:hypothetical protein